MKRRLIQIYIYVNFTINYNFQNIYYIYINYLKFLLIILAIELSIKILEKNYKLYSIAGYHFAFFFNFLYFYTYKIVFVYID